MTKAWEKKLIEDCDRTVSTEFRECHRIAARILGGPDGKCDKLHRGILDCLTEIDDLCRADGGEVRSRQTVAIFIFAWRNANPGVKAYSE